MGNNVIVINNLNNIIQKKKEIIDDIEPKIKNLEENVSFYK